MSLPSLDHYRAAFAEIIGRHDEILKTEFLEFFDKHSPREVYLWLDLCRRLGDWRQPLIHQ